MLSVKTKHRFDFPRVPTLMRYFTRGAFLLEKYLYENILYTQTKVFDGCFYLRGMRHANSTKLKKIYNRLVVTDATKVVWTAQHLISTFGWKLVSFYQNTLH